jgi:uncharacterized protein (TIGR04255 family)
MDSKTPSYENPPVVEVALSLQFEPIEMLRSVHFGLLWSRLRREGFSQVEDHGALEPVYEDFALSSPRIGITVQTFADAPPLPRVWFLNADGTELIQIQSDRLIVNWRRGAGAEPYPRYTHILKRFKAALQLLSELIAEEHLGKIVPNQCEVTYVNHILAEKEWPKHGDIAKVVTVWSNQYSDSYLGTPEDVAFVARYRMVSADGATLGRLQVSLQPAFRRDDHQPIFALNVTARGTPSSPSVESALELFDKQHEWIVRGFASVTTAGLHKLWGRLDG